MIYGSDAGFEPPTPSDKQERINNILTEIAQLENERFNLRMEKEDVLAAVGASAFLTYGIKDAIRERYKSEDDRMADLIRSYHEALADLGFNT